MAEVEVKVPDIGDFKDVQVIEVLVKPGDAVKAEQSLVTVESDKASMEIPSSHSGVVKSLKVKIGDKVNQGTLLLTLDADQASAPVPPNVPQAAAPKQAHFDAVPAAPPAPARAPSVVAGGVANVEVPDIGDFKDVQVIEVFIKAGDVIKVEQSLLTVESDKASMEIPSGLAGKVKDVLVKLGDKVSRGSVIATVEQAGEAQPSPQAPLANERQGSVSPSPAPAGEGRGEGAVPAPRNIPTAPLPPHEPSAPKGDLPHASPSIRKLARELGVPLEEVKGTAPKGRITDQDVHAFVKAVMAGQAQTKAQAATGGSSGGAFPGLLPWPQVDFTKFGPVERQELGRIRKISGANLHRNWVVIPHVTNHDDADITDLEAFRVQLNKENEKAGIKVTMLAFLIKASVAALKKFPTFNASLDGDQLVLKQYFHIGFAADTPNGLMVPVIRDADKKGIFQISQEMSDLAKKARDGKLSPSEMQGGCFSISSLGGIGGRYFTPIINAPEVAILGVCRNQTEPKWDGQAFQPRVMLPLSLSWDHRVVDGAAAARFNAYLTDVLGDFRRVLL